MSPRRRKNPLHACGHDAFDHVKDGAGPCTKCDCKGCKPVSAATRDNRAVIDKTKMHLARQQLFAEISQSVDRFLKNVISVSEGGKLSIPTITPSKRKTSFSSVGEILSTIGKEVPRAEVNHAGATSKGALRTETRALPDEGSGSDLAARTILKVLVQHGPSSRQRVALIAGYSHKSGSFAKALARLRALDYLAGSADRLTATGAGAAWLGPMPPLPTGTELADHWCAQLAEGPARILRTLLVSAVDPARGLSRTQIATLTGYSETSGSFAKALAKLRGLGLISGSANAITTAKELR